MSSFGTWLATSPYATALKVAVSAAIAWLIGNPNALNLPPWAWAVITVAGPVLINALNGKDTRYGRGKLKAGE